MAGDDFIVFGKPKFLDDEIAAVAECMRRGWIGTGPKVSEFEEKFRAYVGADHAVAVHSCTAALFLSQLALGIGPGDAVVTTPLTFVATASSVRHTGAVPLFVDVDARTGLLRPDDVAAFFATACTIGDDGALVHEKSRARVAAILPVHLWGQPCDMDGFRALADRHNLVLIEDAAHAIESTVGARHVGTTADASCFSFYATKNLSTGEGGMVTTARADVAARVRTLSQHGLSASAWSRYSASGFRHYVAVEPGWKFNMMDLQAAIGLPQLARLEEAAVERRRQWDAYRDELRGLPGVELPPADGMHGRHALHLFTLRITPSAKLRRDDVIEALRARGVGSGVHYVSISRHPAHAAAFATPPVNAEAIGDETLSIPLGGALTESERVRVVAALRVILA